MASSQALLIEKKKNFKEDDFTPVSSTASANPLSKDAQFSQMSMGVSSTGKSPAFIKQQSSVNEKEAKTIVQ